MARREHPHPWHPSKVWIFTWQAQYQRLSKDYEFLLSSSRQLAILLPSEVVWASHAPSCYRASAPLVNGTLSMSTRYPLGPRKWHTLAAASLGLLLALVVSLLVSAPVRASGDSLLLQIANGTSFLYGQCVNFNVTLTLGAPPTGNYSYAVNVHLSDGQDLETVPKHLLCKQVG